MTVKKRTAKLLMIGLSLMHHSLSFANDWFPKIATSDDITQGGKSSMTVASNYIQQGMGLVLFVASVSMFIKFISVVSHGIEEAKKSEGGSLTVFGTFAVMAIIYLCISIATGYVGYYVITNFKL